MCIVDARCWSPQADASVRDGRLHGLTQALLSEGSVQPSVTRLALADLWLAPFGVANNLNRQLERCRVRFAELRAEFNYVLVSAPPLTCETEATLLGRAVDGMVLIVEANKSKRDSVRRAKEHLEKAQVRVLGVVLDQHTFPIPKFLDRKH